MTRMMLDHHQYYLKLLGVTWDIYLRELLSHRGEVLSGLRIFISESVVSHLVFWVFSCGVLCCFWLGCFVCVFLEYTWLLLSPVLQYVGIANHRLNVLMTVRASSVHGMSSKKKDLSHGILLATSPTTPTCPLPGLPQMVPVQSPCHSRPPKKVRFLLSR